MTLQDLIVAAKDKAAASGKADADYEAISLAKEAAGKIRVDKASEAKAAGAVLTAALPERDPFDTPTPGEIVIKVDGEVLFKQVRQSVTLVIPEPPAPESPAPAEAPAFPPAG